MGLESLRQQTNRAQTNTRMYIYMYMSSPLLLVDRTLRNQILIEKTNSVFAINERNEAPQNFPSHPQGIFI